VGSGLIVSKGPERSLSHWEFI